jgi:hypothetical protein
MRRVGSELEFDARIDFTQFTGIRDFDATDDLSLVAIADWTFSNNGGRVLVFERAGTSYSLVQTITGSTLLGPNQRLGRDVRFHGDRMYVASRMFRFDPDSGEPTYGAVHIFERINGAWEVVDTVFPAPPSILSTGFGTAMYVDDDLIVVSARTDSSQSSNQGSVWIFEQDGGIWRNTQRIRPYDGVSQDGFGAHVARSDGQLLIVADSTDISGPRSGAVYRYRKIENLWTPCERFASPYSPDPDEFGLAFDASNEVIVVSAPLVFPAPNGRVLAFKAELTPAPPSAFTLAGPADGAVELGTTLALLWNAALEVGGYRVDVASDPAFSAMMYTVEVGASDTSLLVPEGVLEDGRRYYWRVAALNDIGQTLNAGGPWTFRTRLLGDLNGSCSVTFEDLNGVLATFGQSGPDLYGDANGDGITDFSDLNLVLSNFGRTCDE